MILKDLFDIQTSPNRVSYKSFTVNPNLQDAKTPKNGSWTGVTKTPFLRSQVCIMTQEKSSRVLSI